MSKEQKLASNAGKELAEIEMINISEHANLRYILYKAICTIQAYRTSVKQFLTL